jgi:hypothetical protein
VSNDYQTNTALCRSSRLFPFFFFFLFSFSAAQHLGKNIFFLPENKKKQKKTKKTKKKTVFEVSRNRSAFNDKKRAKNTPRAPPEHERGTRVCHMPRVGSSADPKRVRVPLRRGARARRMQGAGSRVD